ncbi:MAG: SDR family oxidoreductase [Ignavibacteriae bacterium]|nr:SDR family oxidoreductase [Ignavibacteriota bacterium]MCB9243391.1 SDR family oxidoreductase [Ignavibacteriales bacterium]
MKDQNKIVWITGTTAGIGKALAVEFANAGHTVICSARRKGKLIQEVKAIEKSGGTAIAMHCDVSKEADVSRTVKNIIKKYGRIDALINNAGVTEFKLFTESTVKDFDNIIGVNLRGAFLCMKAVLPGMIKKKDGQIINILSVAAITTFEYSSIYAASKAGLKAMSEGIRKEIRKYNIKVTNIMPGATISPMWDKDFAERNKKRMMKAEDIARLTLDAFNQPKSLVTEDIVVRPIKGDV